MQIQDVVQNQQETNKQFELKLDDIVNLISTLVISMQQSRNNTPYKSSNIIINHFPIKEGESALNYVRSQRESKYKEEPKTLSANSSFERHKNTTGGFYKQHPELHHLLNYINSITD